MLTKPRGASWNRYASAFAKANQASVTNIHDGGIAGPAFFDHVARLRTAGARVAEAPCGADAPDVDPPACPIPGAPVDLVASSPRR